MTDTEAARTGGQPDAETAVPAGLAVVIGRSGDISHLGRVDAPDRVLRIWALLGNAADDLRVEYATVLAWTASLLTEVLTQLDAVGAGAGRAAGLQVPVR